MVRRRRRSTIVAMMAIGATMMLGQAAVAAPVSPKARPSATPGSTLCALNSAFCSGHWTKIGGRRAYELKQRVVIGPQGQLRPAVADATGIQTLKNHGPHDVCLSTGGADSPRANIMIYTCASNDPNQEWAVYSDYLGAGLTEYQFDSVNAPDYCMNNSGFRTTLYNVQILWQCESFNSGAFNEWYYVGNDNGGLQIVAANSNGSLSNMCVSGLGNPSGNPVELFTCNESANQTWGTV